MDLGKPSPTEGKGQCSYVNQHGSYQQQHHPNYQYHLQPVFDGLLALNDNKMQVDHKTGGSLPNDFWANVAETVNTLEEDNATALQVVMSEEDAHYDEVVDLDLQSSGRNSTS
jgi:hypothetical protein